MGVSKANYTEFMASQLASRSTTLVVIESGLLVIMMLAALLGNLVILVVFLKRPPLRTVTNLYITSLAVSDIITAGTVMPFSVSILIRGERFFSKVTCTVFGFLSWLLVFGTLQTTSLIAINRYFCVVKPQLYRKWFTKKKASIMIGLVWLMSFFSIVILSFSGFAEFDFSPEKFNCFLVFRTKLIEEIFFVVSTLMFLVIPASAMFESYANVLKAIRQHQEQLVANGNVEMLASRPTIEEIKMTKPLLALVLGFILCWLPVMVIQALQVFWGGTLPRYAHVTFTFCALASSVINPFIYGLLNRIVRTEIALLFGFRNRRVSVEDQSFPMHSNTVVKTRYTDRS